MLGEECETLGDDGRYDGALTLGDDGRYDGALEMLGDEWNEGALGADGRYDGVLEMLGDDGRYDGAEGTLGDDGRYDGAAYAPSPTERDRYSGSGPPLDGRTGVGATPAICGARAAGSRLRDDGLTPVA